MSKAAKAVPDFQKMTAEIMERPLFVFLCN
jgi:hypothetical protein